MAAFLIKRTEHWHPCETCGSYRDEVVAVEQDGAEILRVRHDDHFGNGDYNPHDPIAFGKQILVALGHTVEVSDAEPPK